MTAVNTQLSSLHSTLSRHLLIVRAIQIFLSFCAMVSIAVVGSGFPLLGYFGFFTFTAVTGMLLSAAILFAKHVRPTMLKADLLMQITLAYDAVYWLFWVIAASNLAQFASWCVSGWNGFAPACSPSQASAAFGFFSWFTFFVTFFVSGMDFFNAVRPRSELQNMEQQEERTNEPLSAADPTSQVV